MNVGCAQTDITFELETLVPGRSCIPSAACGPTWITIRNAEGEVLPTASECQTSCTDCSATPCPDVVCESQIFDRPVAFTWQGAYSETSECEGTSCISPACAPAGDYVAEICLERAVPPEEGSTECIPTGTIECDEVPFSWPPMQSQIVTLTIETEPSP